MRFTLSVGDMKLRYYRLFSPKMQKQYMNFLEAGQTLKVFFSVLIIMEFKANTNTDKIERRAGFLSAVN
jgi:hypothetical protein